jgi:hypothetical protein
VERTVAELSRQDGGFSKLDCFIRLDKVKGWISGTRDLITDAYPSNPRTSTRCFNYSRRD